MPQISLVLPENLVLKLMFTCRHAPPMNNAFHYIQIVDLISVSNYKICIMYIMLELQLKI